MTKASKRALIIGGGAVLGVAAIIALAMAKPSAAASPTPSPSPTPAPSGGGGNSGIPQPMPLTSTLVNGQAYFVAALIPPGVSSTDVQTALAQLGWTAAASPGASVAAQGSVGPTIVFWGPIDSNNQAQWPTGFPFPPGTGQLFTVSSLYLIAGTWSGPTGAPIPPGVLEIATIAIPTQG